MQTRREFLKNTAAVAITAGIGIPSAEAVPRRKKPNIIVVFADQLRSMSLGCYGDKQAKTPNLDRLAFQGARFTNAISTWPVCSPFRAMLITGRYPMSNGVIHNQMAPKPGQPTIARVLKENGYATGYIGKWHLDFHTEPFVEKENRQGFDYWAVRNLNHNHFDSFYCGDTPEQIPLPGYEPAAQTDLAIRYIESNKDNPFCLFMSWGPPHDPYKAPEDYEKRFPAEKMQLRENVSESTIVREQLEKNPIDATTPVGEKRAKWRKWIDSDDGIRGNMSPYYAATTALDDCVGKLMLALQKAGLADDTILVFTSDHGDMMGSHRMASKQEPFEEAISIPFIIRYPRKIPKLAATDALLSPIDIMPTLLALAGIECPEEVEGISLAEAAVGGASDQQDALLIMKMVEGGNPWVANAATPWRGVRTKTHTYVRLEKGGPWLLFDNKSDPYQMKNLVNDPAHQALKDEMESKLKALLEKAHDPFDTEKILDQIEPERKKES